MNAMVYKVLDDLRLLLPASLFLAVYDLKLPWAKGQQPSGAVEGKQDFQPDHAYYKALYDLCFPPVFVPLSKYDLQDLLTVDLTEVLPPPSHAEFPQQCLGMIHILDQSRGLTSGYMNNTLVHSSIRCARNWHAD
jgi:hypothetical protein